MRASSEPLLIDNVQNDGETLQVILELLYDKHKELSEQQLNTLIGVAWNLSSGIDTYLSTELDRQCVGRDQK